MSSAMLIIYLLSLIYVSSPISVWADWNGQCVVTGTDGKMSAVYDLTSLHKQTSYFVNSDIRDTETEKYTFGFNICDAASFVKDPSSPVDWNRVCDNATLHDNAAPGSAAYQVYQQGTTSHCQRLGYWNNAVKPLNNGDLSKGISIQYTDGRNCSKNGVVRNFFVTVFCDSQSLDPVGVHEDTIGNNRCTYEVIFHSPAGCPRSCPLAVGASGDKSLVCAGQGICGMDHEKGPRCFCKKGWNGNDCTKSDQDFADSSASCTGVCVALIFVLILLIILLIGGSIIYYRVHKLSTMNITFSALTESFATNAGVENRADDEDELAGDVSLQSKNPIRGTRSDSSHTAPSSADFVVDDLND